MLPFQENLIEFSGLDREIVAYLAGFFDGEGCIQFFSMQKGKYISVALQVVNSDVSPLHLFRENFGGKIYHHSRGCKGVEGKEMWAWYLGGKKRVALALQLMLPYLRVKQQRAITAIDLCQHINTKALASQGLKEKMVLRQGRWREN